MTDLIFQLCKNISPAIWKKLKFRALSVCALTWSNDHSQEGDPTQEVPSQAVATEVANISQEFLQGFKYISMSTWQQKEDFLIWRAFNLICHFLQ